MENYSVYITINLLNNRGYVGMTNGHNKSYFGSDKDLRNDIKEFGRKNFSKTTLGTFEDWKECHYWEGFYVKNLKTHISEGGYNKSITGGAYKIDGRLEHHTEETKKKISNTEKGRVSPMKGKHQTEKSKKKTSEALTGRISPMKGRHHTEESKRNISLHSDPNNKGRFGNRPR
jgi:group I intron endonuclease